MNNSQFPLRINKFLAEQGYATRKGADELIKAGKVLINGRIAALGDKVKKEDKVEVKEAKKDSYEYYAYYKPRGVITHSPGPKEKEIKDVVGLKNVFPIGRLDKDSHGLILLTNDGRVTDRLLNPEYAHEKEYLVETKERIGSNFKERMEKGVRIEGYLTKKCHVQILDNHRFSIILTEGKKHQIKRMCVALKNEVTDLKRVRIMNIKLGNLKPGQFRKLESKELSDFLRNLKLSN